MITFKQLQEKLSDKEYKEVDALLNRDTLLRGNLIKNPTQRQKFASMSGRDTFRRLKRNEDGKLRIDRGTEKKIKVNTQTVSKNFPELFKKRAKKYANQYTLPPVRSIDDRLKEKEAIKKKYATEGVASLALKGGSKLIPLLMTGIGAAGTIMQARRVKRSRENPIESRKNKDKTTSVAKDLGLDLTDPRQRRKAQSRAVARGLKKKGKTNKTINPKTDELVRSRYGKISNTDKIMPKSGEAQKAKELVDKYNKRGRPRKGSSPYRKNIRPDILDDISKKTPPENQFNSYDPLKEEVPTNNASSSNIAGLPPDNPPVKRKKKTYAYGGRGSRKMWMNNK